MQQGGGVVERRLGFRRAADGKIHDPERMAVVPLLMSASRDAGEQRSGRYRAMDRQAPSICPLATRIFRNA
jgi:hypothetical protein